MTAFSAAIRRFALVLVVTSWCAAAHASERRFTYVYETTTQPKGAMEYEQWVTWKTDKPDDSSFDRVEFRHEFEFGLTDKLQLGLYAADWRYENGRSVGNDGVEYRNSAIELIYSLMDPTADAFGLALYGEYKGGPELHEIEAKLLLQKNVGSWVFAWNGIIEAEWEEQTTGFEESGEIAQSLGASYQFSPSLTAGVELLHEIPLPGWDEADDDVLYLGPNVSYRSGSWWITVTQLFQVTDVGSEADFQTRLIFGFDF